MKLRDLPVWSIAEKELESAPRRDGSSSLSRAGSSSLLLIDCSVHYKMMDDTNDNGDASRSVQVHDL